MSGDPATSRPQSLFPREPRRVGKFEFLMRLGQGGMATVYLARSLGTGGFQRLVAIKLMHQFLSADDQFVEMFLDEARVAANIRHPNCVSIVDLGNEAEQLFMVMDYVEGDTLAAVEGTAARLGRAIPLGVVLRVVLDALSGLDAAHELKTPDGVDLKVVHRDVSPQNILVGVDGTARLTDFGIARAEQRIATTRTGMLKGKAPFMAPEQFEGRPVDRRADVFAMGVTLWEAVALRRLFPGRETYEQALRNTRAPYRKLKDILPSVPASLDEIVRKALAHNPADRFPTAAAFADALEQEFRSVLATPRQVGSFMAAVAADKIQRERDAVRNAPKPAEETVNPRSSGRTSTRNTYGSRRAEEPIPATAARAFESRPPVTRTSGAPKPANDTAPSDDDPEVAAALLALTELPVDRATIDMGPAVPLAAQAELPKPLIRDEHVSKPPSRRPRAVVDFGPPARSHGAAPEPGSNTLSQRPRAQTLQLSAPRRDEVAELPAVAQPSPTGARRHAATLAAAPSPAMAPTAAPTRTPELSSMLTRDIGGPDAQTMTRPQPTPRPRARQNTPKRPPLGEGVGDATIEFKLVTAKVKEAAEQLEQERPEKPKALFDAPPISIRAPAPPPASAPALTADAKAAADRRVAQFPSLTPSPRGPAVLHNRWVSGAVLATVVLVILFVLTRGL